MSVEIRDRFFALSGQGSGGRADAGEVARFRAEVDGIEAHAPAVVDGIDVNWFPTAGFKALRFVEAERIDDAVRGLYARPSAGAPGLAAVFVDPTELSFRTFENIVALDHVLTGVPLALDLTGRAQLAPSAVTFTLDAPAAARDRLDSLDGLDLYVTPLNAASRGGRRYIFHSALLADALTAAVKSAMPELDGFSHVNPVFRCNRFEPDDGNFHPHLDTPYYDAARRHVSRYTMLIYLTGGTGGTGAPVLDIEGTPLETVEPYTCVIFDQRYRHEGAPFLDGRKVFLRTELVFGFAEGEVAHDPEIAALFSKACYWTGESVFAPELAAHADEYYNRVAAAHWTGLAERPKEAFVHKEFRGVHFVANGFDFWFTKDLPLAECAAITLLDYFNCRLGDTAFRAQCRSEPVEADGTAWIPGFLAGRTAERTVPPFDKAHLFPEPEEGDGGCCPFHATEFDASRLDGVVDYYAGAQTFAKAHIMPAPILMLGEDVVLDPEKFLVRGNQIHVLGDRELAPLNFASCWAYQGENYIETAATVDAAHFLVPPILFTETADGYHLQFDFFRNSWMVRHEQATVPVPMIREWHDDFDTMRVAEASPWLNAVSRVPALRDGAWWTHDRTLRDTLRTFAGNIDEHLAEIRGEIEDAGDGAGDGD